jgi:hypothetical protein
MTRGVIFLIVSTCASLSDLSADQRLEYFTNFRFSLLDSLSNGYSRELPAEDPGANELQPTSGRSLGLTKAAVTVKGVSDLRHFYRMTLRPEAAFDERAPVSGRPEWDSRSGQVRQTSRRIYLLDEYSIGTSTDSTRFEIGVRGDLFTQSTDVDRLDFGLDVRGPVNSLIIEGEWSFGSGLSGTGSSARQAPYKAVMTVFQGMNERNEGWASDRISGDEAPVASSPYPGLGAEVHFHPPVTAFFGSFIGAAFSRNLATHRYSEVLVGATAGYRLIEVAYPTVFQGIVRLLDESGIYQQARPKDLQQMHLALLSVTEVARHRSVILMADYGKGELPGPNDPAIVTDHQGYQIQIGYKAMVLPSLWGALYVAHEDRTATTSGVEVGAFGDSNKRVGAIQRYLLNIAYQTGGSL